MKIGIRVSVIFVTLILSTFPSGCLLEEGEEGEGTIKIETLGEFEFNPQDIETVRPDIFKEGHFSIFDILVYLDKNGSIAMDYHFDETMNTHVIDSIGSAGVVRSYWVSRINDDVMRGRCGFVYEAGSLRYHGARGNHIHIPSDTRVINSPEYEEWFWICL